MRTRNDTSTVITQVRNFKFCMVAALLVSLSLAQTKESPEVAFNRLASVERFAIGGVGYAGRTSEGEKDFRVILAQPSAIQNFERLFTAGNAQAKAYALTGLYRLNSPKFKELAQSLRTSKVSVVTMAGCIIEHETLGEVIKRIEKGEVIGPHALRQE